MAKRPVISRDWPFCETAFQTDCKSRDLDAMSSMWKEKKKGEWKTAAAGVDAVGLRSWTRGLVGGERATQTRGPWIETQLRTARHSACE